MGTLLLAALWELGGVALQCCVVFPEWTEINWCMYMYMYMPIAAALVALLEQEE